jgi:hypothetical protein
MSYLGFFNALISNNGIPITATVTVYLAGTATKATIYSTPSGTLKDNPFQTDVLGRFQFFAAAGQYDIEISGAGITTYKIEYVNISDVTELAQALLAKVSGIDAKATGTTLLYTVPTGKTLVVTLIVIRIMAFTAGSKSVQAVANFGSNSAAYDNYVSGRTYTVAAQNVMAREAAGAYNAFVPTHPAAAEFKINITTGSNATTETWEVSVFGFLV